MVDRWPWPVSRARCSTWGLSSRCSGSASSTLSATSTTTRGRPASCGRSRTSPCSPCRRTASACPSSCARRRASWIAALTACGAAALGISIAQLVLNSVLLPRLVVFGAAVVLVPVVRVLRDARSPRAHPGRGPRAARVRRAPRRGTSCCATSSPVGRSVPAQLVTVLTLCGGSLDRRAASADRGG